MKTGRGPTTEEMLCAMALKSSHGRQTHHTQAGLLVCCEQALKGVGERNTHGGGAYRCGDLRETARAREATLRGGVKWLCLIWKAAIWRWGLPPAGELSTGNIGSLCEWQLLKALRAPCGPILQYEILYYIGWHMMALPLLPHLLSAAARLVAPFKAECAAGETASAAGGSGRY